MAKKRDHTILKPAACLFLVFSFLLSCSYHITPKGELALNQTPNKISYTLENETPYKIEVERKAEASNAGSTIIITAIPGSVNSLKKTYRIEKNRYKDIIKQAAAIGFTPLLFGALFLEPIIKEIDKASVKEGRNVKIQEGKYTAVGRNAYLTFRKKGKRFRIYLGTFDHHNKIKMSTRKLMDRSKYLFKKEEEVLHYLFAGKIEIDWVRLN